PPPPDKSRKPRKRNRTLAEQNTTWLPALAAEQNTTWLPALAGRMRQGIVERFGRRAPLVLASLRLAVAAGRTGRPAPAHDLVERPAMERTLLGDRCHQLVVMAEVTAHSGVPLVTGSRTAPLFQNRVAVLQGA